MERQELCRAGKGDKAKANGPKRERKTIQDEKILTTRSAKSTHRNSYTGDLCFGRVRRRKEMRRWPI